MARSDDGANPASSGIEEMEAAGGSPVPIPDDNVVPAPVELLPENREAVAIMAAIQ